MRERGAHCNILTNASRPWPWTWARPNNKLCSRIEAKHIPNELAKLNQPLSMQCGGSFGGEMDEDELEVQRRDICGQHASQAQQ